MTIDEVIEETTINFKHDLNLDETESLFLFIAEKLPANISYHTGYFRDYRYEEDGVTTSNGTVEISGMISRIREPYSFDSFTGVHSEMDTSKFSSFHFSRIPGYEISEYRPVVRQLWDDVREIVEDYFEIPQNAINKI